MDFEERLRLETLYASYSDEMLLQMLSQDPGSYREGVYDLLQYEVRRRRIDPGSRQEPAPSDEQAGEEIVYVVIYAGAEAQVMDLGGTLEFEGISTFVRDERTSMLDGPGRLGVIKLAVEKRDVDRATEMILQMLPQDPGSCQEEVSDLFQSEVERSRIDTGAWQEPVPFDEQAAEEIVFVVIYAGSEAQAMDLRGTLAYEGISTFVRDERTSMLDERGRIGVIKLAVEKKDVEKARRIIEKSSP